MKSLCDMLSLPDSPDAFEPPENKEYVVESRV
jgi:hypothetical protein